MKSGLWLSLAVAVVMCLATESFARGGRGGGRPGGGGGARSGGGRPGGDVKPGGDFNPGGAASAGGAGKQAAKAGNRKDGEQFKNFQNKFSDAQSKYGAKAEPFSPSWYANHPRAWQYAHPRANAWAVATFGAAAGWLGINAIANNGGTVYTSDSEDDEASDDWSQSDGEQLAEQGAVDLPADESFLTLGVFALSPQGQKDATALVQLAVSKDGVLRGTYYDLLTDQEQAIQGAVDKKSQRIAWTVSPNGPVLFETSLANLTQPKGQLTLRFESGQTKTWSLARYEGDNTPTR